MTFWVAGAVVGSSLIGANAAGKAAEMQSASADRAAQLQNEQFNKQVELQEPWRQAGVNALGKLQSGDVMSYMDPSYKFRLGEGLKALDRQAAARGGLISGGALKAAQRYGQEFASNEFGNAYNRVAGLAGIGQTATNQLGAAGQTTASNIGGLMTSGAAARASGYVGGANAMTGGLNQYLNYTQGNNLITALQNRNPNAVPAGYGNNVGDASSYTG